MTGYTSKRKVALDKLDDDDIQTYQRPWVGLMEEEIDTGRRAPWGFNLDAFTAGAKFAEAALKEKNYG